MGGIQPWHIILVVVVFLLLFGGKKLPDAARGLGRSLRILKSEVGAMHDEDGSKAKAAAASETDITAKQPTAASQIAPAPIAQPVIQAPVASVPSANGAMPVTVPASTNGQPAPSFVVPAPVVQPVINVPVNGSHGN